MKLRKAWRATDPVTAEENYFTDVDHKAAIRDFWFFGYKWERVFVLTPESINKPSIISSLMPPF